MSSLTDTSGHCSFRVELNKHRLFGKFYFSDSHQKEKNYSFDYCLCCIFFEKRKFACWPLMNENWVLGVSFFKSDWWLGKFSIGQVWLYKFQILFLIHYSHISRPFRASSHCDLTRGSGWQMSQHRGWEKIS